MIVTHKINMDLVRRGTTPYIDVVQDDKYSRNIQIDLHENGRNLDVPADCTVLIRYKKPDGMGGAYDTMPDGTQAWTIAEHSVTIRVAPQVCTASGDVALTVTLLQGEQELNCFAICLRVQELPRARMRSNAYVNISGFLPQTDDAAVGQYLQIEEVDTQGRVTKLKPVPAPSGADWNVPEGAPGHVLNRTHWAEQGEALILPETVIVETENPETGAMEWNCTHYAIPFAVGRTYVVTWNGVDYEYVCREITMNGITGRFVGNPAAVGETPDNCPFTVGSAPSMSYSLVQLLDGSSPAGNIIRIVEKRGVTHKLDDRYINADWLAQKAVTETERLPETALKSIFTQGLTMADVSQYEKVKVVFDGVEFVSTVCMIDETGYFIGNFWITSNRDIPTNGEPYLVFVESNGDVTIVTHDGGAHTITIYAIQETVSKMPEEFLPEGYGKDELVAAVIAALPSAEGVSF